MTGITILGLGPGDPAKLTLEAWETLKAAKEVYLRTSQHPTVQGLPEGLIVLSFDQFYEQEETFAQVYQRIVEQVLALGRRDEGVLYAVPGHPYVAEATGVEIARLAAQEGMAVHIIDGLSFLEPTFSALRIDPLPQTSLVDALELVSSYYPGFPPHQPALVAQLYSKKLAGEIKITLMSQYPDEHEVILVHAAGTRDEKIERLPLHQIDKSERIGLLTSLYLPPVGEYTSFEGFQDLIAHLRSPEGCPWDREQTHQTLRTNLLEEAYEAIDAIDRDDQAEMQEEFGDLLLQIVLQTQIASEYGEFNMTDVIRGIHTKLVRRHPHVFGDIYLDDADSVIKNWEAIKAEERSQNHDFGKGVLDGIPKVMPALSVAEKYQRRAARVGFDWPEIGGVVDKLEEELAELRAAEGDQMKAEEFGDLLFVLVNLGRWWGIDSEDALRQTNQKFKQRFAAIEAHARNQGIQLSDMTLEEMEEVWQAAKKE
ncbi:MAG: nucleoside triphosphate pyrophosphohydrolase [Anaerolineales bacterium]|nr:nucleoside triphosphate pyrophosphohydrolase [Anaerolineales bacterium]